MASSNSSDVELNISRRWHLRPGVPEVKAVRARLDAYWARWAVEKQERLLTAVEQIAHAENAKLLWKENRSGRLKDQRLAKLGVAAASTADAILSAVPHPLPDGYEAIGDLVKRLAGFAEAALDLTAVSEKDVAIRQASALLAVVKPMGARRQAPPWDLIGDLVFLASKGQVQPKERTIRRYAGVRPRARKPARAIWTKNWELMRRVGRLVPEASGEQFERALLLFLTTPSKA